MWKPLFALALAAVWSAPLAAQEATEIFIPIGKSPGVSERNSVIGPVDSVDEKGRTFRLGAPGGAVTVVVVTDKTRIWRDRSAIKQANQVGSFVDVQKGRTVEARLEPGEGQRKAEWIKVRITEATPE